MSEKTLPASKKRLREARRKGQVVQTPSLPHLLATVGVIETTLGTRSTWMPRLQDLLTAGIHHLAVHGSPLAAGMDAVIVPFAAFGLTLSIVALVTAAVLGLIGNLAQVGFSFASESLLQLDKFNPIAHAKQMFSAEKLIGLGTNAAKTLGIGLCACIALIDSSDSVVHAADADLDTAAEVFFDLLRHTERLALGLLMVTVAVDWALRKYFFDKSQRMDREEKDRETKDMFGDKNVRQSRKSFERDILGTQLVENTRNANAVVTNPTHFAVALLYDPDRFPLPVVLARGTDASAQLMKRVARERGIPVIRSVWLARTLYSVGREKRPIPRLTIRAVAAVYRAIAQAAAAGEEIGADDVDLDAR